MDTNVRTAGSISKSCYYSHHVLDGMAIIHNTVFVVVSFHFRSGYENAARNFNDKDLEADVTRQIIT